MYILKSAKKKWFYVGSTNRLFERLSEHNNCAVRSTRSYTPFNLFYKIGLPNEGDARAYEQKLKKCRIEKEKIIKEIENLDL